MILRDPVKLIGSTPNATPHSTPRREEEKLAHLVPNLNSRPTPAKAGLTSHDNRG